MPGGSLNVRLAGGADDDTIQAVIALDPRSTGPVTAMVLGGAGNDNLTLDAYCPDDKLVARIIGGSGRNTILATSNVQVTN
jgi:hypothetical protein